MLLAEKICSLNTGLPARFDSMLAQALLLVKDDAHRDDLCAVACAVAGAAWQRWLSARTAEDNRQEHEWVVFANVMRIAEDESLSLSDKRVATAFTFTHDSFFIPRVTEQQIREATTPELKARLEQEKERQRLRHMKVGAANADSLLRELKDPRAPEKLLFTPGEIARCVALVAGHDLWKMPVPEPPPTHDRLALACVEGDALWPLHPLGVLADLERPNGEGVSKDFSDPEKWRAQLLQSCQTLVEFRPKWKEIPEGDFVDGESIFRTPEGARLYHEWRGRWNLDPA